MEEEDDSGEVSDDEQDRLKNLKISYSLLKKFLMFALELINFLKNYEYFLFQSVIAN